MPKPIDLLIVDDDADYRSTLVRRFQRRGYAVQEACDGTEALELAARRQFDVAIVDMTMPRVSGLEVLDKFKTIQPECEVIMHTAEANDRNGREGHENGSLRLFDQTMFHGGMRGARRKGRGETSAHQGEHVSSRSFSSGDRPSLK